MPVITISRQLGSMGTEIAQLLSKEFSCSYLDKESLEEVFTQFGISKDSVERFDERKPGFWDLFKTDKARYLHFLKGAIYEFAHKDDGIILGRGGQVILGRLPGVLHVRFISPESLRKKRVMKRFDCDDRHALKYIHHSDNERAGFHNFFFDEDWEDLNLYDLIINTGSFSTQTAARLITDVVSTKEFSDLQENTTRMLADLCLQYEIKTGIVYTEKIMVQFLEVESKNAIVTLRGIVENKEDIFNCEKIASETIGVEKVRNEIYYSPITTTYGVHY
jgi:cytidylate kinase